MLAALSRSEGAAVVAAAVVVVTAVTKAVVVVVTAATDSMQVPLDLANDPSHLQSHSTLPVVSSKKACVSFGKCVPATQR